MNFGFHFQIPMAGVFHFLDAPTDEKEISFLVTARVPHISRAVLEWCADVEGVLSMEGFADRRPVHGRISASFTEELHIRYDFRFKANDGEEHALRAEQCFLAVDPIGSFTTLDATIYDAQARERARALLRFDAKRELGPMVRSLRIDATFLPFQVS